MVRPCNPAWSGPRGLWAGFEVLQVAAAAGRAFSAADGLVGGSLVGAGALGSAVLSGCPGDRRREP